MNIPPCVCFVFACKAVRHLIASKGSATLAVMSWCRFMRRILFTRVFIAGSTLLTVAGAAGAGVKDDCCDGFATGNAVATTGLAIALLDDTLCGDELLSLAALILCCSGATGTAAIAPNVPNGGCCGDAVAGLDTIGLGCTLVVAVVVVVGPDCSGTGSIDIGIGDLSCCCCDDNSGDVAAVAVGVETAFVASADAGAVTAAVAYAAAAVVVAAGCACAVVSAVHGAGQYI
eukprot:17215-Heterococcus_DN1.PRE.1